MKIQKSKSPRTKTIILTVTAILLIGSLSYAALAWQNSYWPFAVTQDESAQKEDSGTTNEDTEQNVDEEPVDSDDTPDTDTPRPNSDQPADDEFISSPISNPPSSNDPYPIENEHYKITQNSRTSYHITLYPIANNPDYSNYSAQLRAYKDEALSYLKERYGNIDSFTFTWSPEDAKNV